MKYIETFEGLTFEIDIAQVKKYTIWEFPTNLIILETLNLSSFGSTFKRLFIYYDQGSNNRLQHSDNQQFIFKNEEVRRRVIFTSDDLQEIYDILPTARDLKKYNL